MESTCENVEDVREAVDGKPQSLEQKEGKSDNGDGGDKSLSMEAEIEQLKKSLSEANQRLSHFLAAFPGFERKKAQLENLLKKEKGLLELVEKLKVSAVEVQQVAAKKEDEVTSLKGRIDSLILVGKGAASKKAEDLEGNDAILILPDEMWRMILGKLEDPKDLWNCSNTCGLFKKILHDFKKPTWEFMHALPFLVQHLPQNKILECRLVSKGWNMVVEQLLNKHGSQRSDRDVPTSRMIPWTPANTLKTMFYLRNWFTPRRLEYFNCEKPDFPYSPGRNPFLGRAVTLVIGLKSSDGRYDNLDFDDLQLENNRFWQTLDSFLTTFGEHIWYLTLDSCEGRLGHGDDHEFDVDTKMSKLLTDLFRLVPNLRKLTIVPSEQEDYEGVEVDEDLFPEAPKLETIEADSQHVGLYNHSLLVALLERYHRQLRAVYLTGPIWTWSIVGELDWPNLTELHLCNDVTDLDLKGLLRAGEMMPQLSKLGVDLRNSSLDTLMDIIHKFFGTSRLNTLCLHGAVESQTFQKKRWEFCMSPTLKTLEVDYGNEDGFYEFLLHFPFVENIHLHLTSRTNPKGQNYNYNWLSSVNNEDKKKAFKLDIQKYVIIYRPARVYMSNIWELLPHLKVFTCDWEWEVYTRSGYEKFSMKKH